MTSVILACVMVLLPLVDNADDYHLYIDDVFITTTSTVSDPVIHEVCIDELHTDTFITYTASNAGGETGMSPPLVLQRVWNFDSDGDGVVGFSDFAPFAASFGKCNNGVKVVDCDF